MTIEQLLIQWKNESLFGERNFQKQSFSIQKGQELYLISIKYIFFIDDKHSRIIEKHRYFPTWVQGLTHPNGINPKADEYVCKQILVQLENSFYSEYNEFIEEEISKKTTSLG